MTEKYYNSYGVEIDGDGVIISKGDEFRTSQDDEEQQSNDYYEDRDEGDY